MNDWKDVLSKNKYHQNFSLANLTQRQWNHSEHVDTNSKTKIHYSNTRNKTQFKSLCIKQKQILKWWERCIFKNKYHQHFSLANQNTKTMKSLRAPRHPHQDKDTLQQHKKNTTMRSFRSGKSTKLRWDLNRLCIWICSWTDYGPESWFK